MNSHPAATTGWSQCNAIQNVLEQRAGQWVPLSDLHEVSGSFVIHSRIADLRARGLQIENRTETDKTPEGRRICRSFYRLVPSAAAAAAPVQEDMALV